MSHEEWLRTITIEYLTELMDPYDINMFNIDIIIINAQQNMDDWFQKLSNKWTLQYISKISNNVPYYGKGHNAESIKWMDFEEDLKATPFWKHYPSLGYLIGKFTEIHGSAGTTEELNLNFGWKLIQRMLSQH